MLYYWVSNVCLDKEFLLFLPIFSSSAPCQPPQQPSVHDVTATNVSIEWVYNGACANSGFVTGFRMTYTSGASRLQLEIPDAGTTSAFLQNLTPLTTYQVNIMVLTSNGRDSVPSEPVQFITKEIGEWLSLSKLNNGNERMPLTGLCYTLCFSLIRLEYLFSLSVSTP